MNTKSLTVSSPGHSKRIWMRKVGRAIARGAALIWRRSADRRAVAAFVGRYSAHLSILALVLLMGVLGPISMLSESFAAMPDLPQGAVIAEPVATSTASPPGGGVPVWLVSDRSQSAIFREASPHTEIPERVRLEVITYTVQPGDTVFTIAEKFGLSPYTIAWANMEQLQGAPWLIQPGLTLFIPPVDGVYHTVMEGETPESIAEQYEVSVSALYNMWNDIEPGKPLREGAMLVIPGGVGEDVEWEPPPPPPSRPGVASATTSWGACGNV